MNVEHMQTATAGSWLGEELKIWQSRVTLALQHLPLVACWEVRHGRMAESGGAK